jgi:SAM-dependent methyltransferase
MYDVSELNGVFMTVSHEVKAQGFGALLEAYRIGRKALPAEVYEVIKNTGTNPDASVLDLGCGTGLSTQSLFPLFKEVRGCDHDPEMLAVARADLKEYNAQFDEGSAEKLPYPDARFHAITLFGAFHWFCTAKAGKEQEMIARIRDKCIALLDADGVISTAGKASVIIARKKVEG